MTQNANRNTLFDDYGTQPSPLVWEKIEQRLPAPAGKKRGWLWWGAAALLAGLIYTSSFFYDFEIKPKQNAQQQNSVNEIEKSPAEVVKQPASEEKHPVASELHNENSSNGTTTSSPALPFEEGKYQGIIKEKKTKAAEPVFMKEKNASDMVLAEDKTENNITDNKMQGEKLPSKIFALVTVPFDQQSSYLVPVIDWGVDKRKYSASRWQLSLMTGWNYNYRILNFTSSSNSLITDAEKNYMEENEAGLKTFSFEGGVSYRISKRLSVVLSINYFKEGQQRSSSAINLDNGDPGSDNMVYSISTSAGNVSGNGALLDYAIFNNSDSAVFPAPPSALGLPQPNITNKTVGFTFRQEFTFIGLPLILQYHFPEQRLTPYFGLGISTAFLVNKKTFANDEEIDYNYSGSLSRLIFFGEAQAGIKYNAGRNLFLKVQPSFRYGFNSLTGSEEVKWIPYSAGIGAGIDYRF